MISFRMLHGVTLAVLAAMVLALVPAYPSVEAAGGVIAYGEVINGQITNKNFYEAWEFTGEAGDRVQILMEGDGNLDPYLGLIEASTEAVLAEDDDSGGNSNAYIELTLSASGNYLIVATRYNLDIGTTQGSYALTLASTNAGSQSNVANTNTSAGTGTASTSDPVEIEPGVYFMGDVALAEPVGNNISQNSYAHLYGLELAGGTELVVAMFADESDLDAYLIFATEDGDVLAEDDDSGVQVGAGKLDAFVQLTVPSTGLYYVIASRSGLDTGKTIGAYALIAAEPEAEGPVQTDTSSESDLPPGMAEFGMIGLDQESNQAITEDAYFHIYGFEGQAGDEITITMRGEDGLDAYLGLLDPADNVVTEDDDSGGDFDAQITTRLAESGVYLIVATRSGLDEGTTTGGYSLVVTSGPPPEAEATGITGFTGLPGRALTNEAGETLYLSGNGRSNDPEKNTPIERFAGRDLPGRGMGLDIPRPNGISLNFEEIKITK